MYRFSKDGVSVLTILDRRRVKNTGAFPVKIEVVFRRHQKYYPAGEDVRIEEWECMWGKRAETKRCCHIADAFLRIKVEVETLIDKGQFSFQALDMRLSRGADDVIAAMDNKMSELLADGKVNSYYRYRSTARAIERFAGRSVPFGCVDLPWLKRCERFWRAKGMSATTINIYMRTLKCVCAHAVDCGIIKENAFPFGKMRYKIPTASVRKEALSKEQIRRIACWNGSTEVGYWRDLWMFSYLCNGINFRDMLYLKYGNIVNGEIVYSRSKTSESHRKDIRATITPYMYDIMKRSGNGTCGQPNDYIFRHAVKGESPVEIAATVRNAIGACNKALRILARELNLPHFTTYAARHSFATVLQREGADISFISESLGHSSITMTEVYLAGFDRDIRKRNAAMLL